MLEVRAIETETTQRNVIAKSRRRFIGKVLADDGNQPFSVGCTKRNSRIDFFVCLLSE